FKARFRKVGDVRGLGPMLGLELVEDRGTKAPDKRATAALARRCYEGGVIVLSAGTWGNVIRFLMPLVIDDDQLEEGLAVVENGRRAGGGPREEGAGQAREGGARPPLLRGRRDRPLRWDVGERDPVPDAARHRR